MSFTQFEQLQFLDMGATEVKKKKGNLEGVMQDAEKLSMCLVVPIHYTSQSKLHTRVHKTTKQSLCSSPAVLLRHCALFFERQPCYRFFKAQAVIKTNDPSWNKIPPQQRPMR